MFDDFFLFSATSRYRLTVSVLWTTIKIIGARKCKIQSFFQYFKNLFEISI